MINLDIDEADVIRDISPNDLTLSGERGFTAAAQQSNA